LTDPEVTPYGVWSHEMAALKHGTFNLGFYAVANRPRGQACLRWFAERTLHQSTIDFENGIFTDQKWANLIPYLFDGVRVLRDRRFNAATWNMTNRSISRSATGDWLVNGEPLRFYHFSGFGNNFYWADLELEAFAEPDSDVTRLWRWYKEQYQANQLPSAAPWQWGFFDNGVPIQPRERRIYRESSELRARFNDPFSSACYLAIRNVGEH
jgi:hypothetical protein